MLPKSRQRRIWIAASETPIEFGMKRYLSLIAKAYTAQNAPISSDEQIHTKNRQKTGKIRELEKGGGSASIFLPFNPLTRTVGK